MECIISLHQKCFSIKMTLFLTQWLRIRTIMYVPFALLEFWGKFQVFCVDFEKFSLNLLILVNDISAFE